MNNELNEKFNKEIKLIKRELQYKGSILEVYKDTVKIDDHISYWDYLKKYDASAILPILPNGKILLVRQYRMAVDKWTLELPAGKLDDGEDFLQCAKRELEEETGYKSDNIEFLCDTYTAVAFCSEIVRIFIAKDLQIGKKNLDLDEETIVEEWDIEDLKKEIFNGNIKDAKTIAGIMSYISKI